MCVPVQRWLERVHAAADRHRRMLQLVLVAHFQPGDQRTPRVHALGVCVSLPARQIAECEWVERVQRRSGCGLLWCSAARIAKLSGAGCWCGCFARGSPSGPQGQGRGRGTGPGTLAAWQAGARRSAPLMRRRVAHRIPSTQKLLTGSPQLKSCSQDPLNSKVA